MRSIIVALVALFVFATGSMAETTPKDQTIQDLQAAFNGESNASAKYKAFAEKADAEGLAQAASLFRAASRAEQIHAANHAEVIKSLGAEPKADVQPAKVGTTADNLKAAIEGESYERDTMYPGFIKNARDAKLTAAVRTLNLAKTAEAEHAKLYAAMLQGVSASEKPQAKVQYYVCPVCGYTAASINGKCPSCFTDKSKFELVG